VKRRDLFFTVGGALATTATRLVPSFKAQSPLEKRFRVVDAHMHVFNSDLQGKNGIPQYLPQSTIEYTLQLMDEGGIDKGLLKGYSAEDVARDIRHAKDSPSPITLKPVISKQYVFESWQAHKDRFWWFQLCVNPVREGYMEDVEETFRKGASGIIVFPLFHGLLFDHRAYFSVYELCRKHKKSIMFEDWYFHHIREPRYLIDNESRVRQKWADSFKSFNEYSRSVLDPVIKEFSRVPICVNHCANPNTKADYDDIFDWIGRHPNLYCDISSVPDYSPSFIQGLVKAVGARKVMYGSDSPWGGEFRRRWRVIADECTLLSHQEKQLILAGNVERYVNQELP
jgi:predicted TIM-barrel fold metal-dependent hydrolase